MWCDAWSESVENNVIKRIIMIVWFLSVLFWLRVFLWVWITGQTWALEWICMKPGRIFCLWPRIGSRWRPSTGVWPEKTSVLTPPATQRYRETHACSVMHVKVFFWWTAWFCSSGQRDFRRAQGFTVQKRVGARRHQHPYISSQFNWPQNPPRTRSAIISISFTDFRLASFHLLTCIIYLKQLAARTNIYTVDYLCIPL